MVNQEKILEMVHDEDAEKRKEAVNQLRDNFTNLQDKNQAWANLYQLTQDMSRIVRIAAVNSLQIVFPQTIYKEKAWENLHLLIQDKDHLIRKSVAGILHAVYTIIPDKKQAWEDLIKLTIDEDSFVRRKAAQALYSAFLHTPDKKLAWEDIHRLTWNKDHVVQVGTISVLRDAFPLIPNKKQAWEDIIRLTRNENRFVRKNAVESLDVVFPKVSNRKKSFEDIYQLTLDENKLVRQRAVELLGAAFPLVSDKEMAWEAIHRLAQDNDGVVRLASSKALSTAFPYILNKKQAWEDLIRLAQDKDLDIMRLGTANTYDLYKPVSGIYNDINDILGKSNSLFRQIVEEMSEQTQDEYIIKRLPFAQSLGAAFHHVPYKKIAYKDLHNLSKDEDSIVRLIAIGALGYAFPCIRDKKQPWEDIHSLTQDDSEFVRGRTASLIGDLFPLIPDKKQAWQDLIQLTKDENSDVRVSANYSLGRICVYKATDVDEENYGKEFNKALEFFEKSSKEASLFNPVRFCLPFYQSFYAITFNKHEAEAEIQKYLAEAKSAVKGSETREKLIDAVENLAKALEETQKVWDFDEMKIHLNASRRYCERAAELLDTTVEKAPGATKLLRRGLPVIDKKIKDLFREIEEEAKRFCKESQQTPFEGISRSAYYYVKGLGDVENTIEAEKRLNRLSPLLRSICDILPEESRKLICSQLNELEETELLDKARIIESTLIPIHVETTNLKKELAEQKRWNEYLKDKIHLRLENINYGVFQLKLHSGQIGQKLLEIQKELDKLGTIETNLNNFGLSLKDLGNLQFHDLRMLNSEINRLVREIEIEVIPKLPQTNDTQMIIEKIQNLKQSKEEVWFNRVAGLSSIISFVITIL